MLRSLLPTTLALLLAPTMALAAPADAAEVGPGTGDVTLTGAAPDQAERSMRRSKSTAKSDGKKDSGDSKKASTSKRSRKSGGSTGPSRGSGSGGSSGSRDSDSPGSDDRRSDAPRSSPSAPPSRDSGERGPDDRGDSARERDSGRDDGRSSRPAPYGSDSRGDDGRLSPEGRSERMLSGSRPLEAARPGAVPSTRRVSAGTPSSASGRPSASGVRAPSSAPANFRGSAERMPVSGHGEPSGRHGGGDSDRGRDGRDGRDGAAERHGHGGSDAERATHGHAGSERHREAVRHARSTAAHHRSSASYHRAAASRHHAWSSARYARHGRWYHPGGWFRPYRPGHAYWYHGVFVYGPGPWHHHHDHVAVDRDRGGDERSDEASVPERKVDRSRTFAVGIRGGSYLGGYDVGGGAFGDAGLGVAARYRPVEAVGFELSWMHHDQTWEDGSERVYQPLQASVQLFGMPWTKVNPYVLAGVTVTGRDVQDRLGFTTVSENSTLWGPHAGIGLELGVGKKASVNFDLRYTGYLNKPEGDLTVPGAAQANMGLNFYF